jgi:hypothetical protein
MGLGVNASDGLTINIVVPQPEIIQQLNKEPAIY